MKQRFSSLSVLVLLLMAAGCDRQTAYREYEETVVASPLADMKAAAEDPHAFMRGMKTDMTMPPAGSAEQDALMKSVVSDVPLKWVRPDGWNEEKGTGMRLSTFRTTGEDSIECSLISLGGMAGGLEANIARWMQQISIDVPGNKEMADFLAKQERLTSEGGLPVTVIDLSALQNAKDKDTPSMIAAVIQTEALTLFVKMTGSRAAVKKHQDAFTRLCRSLKIEQPATK